MTSIETWWSKLPAPIRLELTADPRGPLSSEAVVAITQAAGIGPVTSFWEGQAPPPAHLTDAEVEWIEARDDDDLADDAEQTALDAIDDALGGFPRDF